MDRINICAVCMYSELGEVEENLKKTEDLCLKAAEKGADIICFPELSITGYILKDPANILPRYYNNKYIINKLIDICNRLNKVIIAGFIEFCESSCLPYITQIITGPDSIIGIYRKTHLSPIEQGIYRAGDDVPIYSFGDFLFGIQLCYEAHFPELSTLMAIKGVDIIFFPHASPRGTPKQKLDSWLRHLRARAFDNGIFIIACNQVGKVRNGLFFPGVAVAIGPNGKIINYIFTERKDVILPLSIDKSYLSTFRSQYMGYFLPYRRPELYNDLIDKK